jgi:cation transport regulator ChaB
MPKCKRGEGSKGGDKQLSTRRKKQIDCLPEHSQHIYKKAHGGAIDQYQILKKEEMVKSRVQRK